MKQEVDKGPAQSLKRTEISMMEFTCKLNPDTELRRLETKDSAELFALTDRCRPYLRRWLPWVDGTREVKDTEAFIDLGLKQAASNNGFHAGIWHQL